MRVQVIHFVVMVCIVLVIAAVAWHSVQEIHYLKSFFPRQFSVAEARDAAVIELIKVLLISFPFIFIWCFLKSMRERNGEAVASKGIGEVHTDREVQYDNRKAKIVAFARGHGDIGNDDVERLLGVSDATATRILQQFEDEGILEQMGTTGRAVRYRLTKGSTH